MVPTVLKKSLNFGFSLKSPWKWICPWKVLEFRGPSLKFHLVVLDFLFWGFWTESLEWMNTANKEVQEPNFKKKNSARFACSSLQVKYFSSFSCSYIILEQLLSYPSFPKNTYRYLCILCVSMYQSVSKWWHDNELVYPPELFRIAGFCTNSNKNFLGEDPQTPLSRIVLDCIINIIQQIM